jgi:hypothetical protein
VLTASQKRDVVRLWLLALPEASNREIGRIVGVGHAMVKARRNEIDHLVKGGSMQGAKRDSAADDGQSLPY